MEKTPWWQVAIVAVLIGIGAGILIGMAIGWRWADSVSGIIAQTANEDATNTPLTTEAGDASVTVGEQPSGRAVVVTNVTLPKTAWIAVHEVIAGETMGNVLGAARRDTGVYPNVIVNLLRATDPDKQYAIVLYADNGNNEFDLKADLPLTTATDDPIIVRFTTRTPLSSTGQ